MQLLYWVYVQCKLLKFVVVLVCFDGTSLIENENESAGVMLCGGCKVSPKFANGTVHIFFDIRENIPRKQKLIIGHES